MNKKIIFSIAAAAALLASTPGMNKAEAATPVSVQSKVYVYQTGNLNQDQINSILKKYLNGNLSFAQYRQNVQELTNGKSTTTTVKQPTQTVKQPAQTTSTKTVQQPTQKAVEQKQTTAPASSQVSAFEQQVLELTNQERAKIWRPCFKA